MNDKKDIRKESGGSSSRSKVNIIDPNIVYVNEFTEDSARMFCQQVLFASMDSHEVPILIYIDSYGGAVDALMSMLGVLDSIPNTIITCCVGKAMSCGAILLSHGDTRFVAPHSRVMIHEIASGNYGNINDILNDMAETNRLNDYFLKLLADNCGFKEVRDLKSCFTNENRDIYMSPKQAVKFGIADQVGMPRLLRQQSYMIQHLLKEPKVRKQRKK